MYRQITATCLLIASLVAPSARAQLLPQFLLGWGGFGAGNGQFNEPYGVAMGPGGVVYVSDTVNHRIQKFDADGNFILAWGSYGTAPGQFDNPVGLTVDAGGNVYVAEYTNDRVQKFDGNGNLLDMWGATGSGPGQFRIADDVCVDAAGHVFVVDKNHHRVQKFENDGTFIREWGGYGTNVGQFLYPVGIACDASGNIYVAEQAGHRIQKFDGDGNFLKAWGSLGTAPGQFNEPIHIDIDAANRVYVPDSKNHRIQVFDSNGNFLVEWGAVGSGPGQFNEPEGVGIDGNGIVYVADTQNDRIQKFRICPLIIMPLALPAGVVGAFYSQPISGTTSCGVTNGSLPAGLSLNPTTGVLAGTPTTPGCFSFTIGCTDANGCSGSRAYTVCICPIITLTPTSLPEGRVGTAYSLALTPSGGTAPYACTMTSGMLPAGLSLNSCAISGTPSAPGCSEFTVTTTDANGCVGNRSYTVTVCAAIALSPTALPDGRVGDPYGGLLTAKGGSAPYRFVVTNGILPPGFSLDPTTGIVGGTSTVAGTYPFTVTATDLCGCTGVRSYTIVVHQPNTVSLVPLGTAITNSNPCLAVDVQIDRNNVLDVRIFSVTVHLSPELALCQPSAIVEGPYLESVGLTDFHVTPDGSGNYVVDGVILGLPCGAKGPTGTLFTVNLTDSGGDGTGTISIADVLLRDCNNGDLPVDWRSPASFIIDRTPPAAITDLAAAQGKTGNDADGTTRIDLTYTSPVDAVLVEVWRKCFGNCPEFDDGPNPGSEPCVPPYPPSCQGWMQVPNATPAGVADEPATPDFWYYLAYTKDVWGNVSMASNRTNGTLNCHLGDVHDGATNCQGNNQIGLADISFLGAHYGCAVEADCNCLDVGPTTDMSVNGRPMTDNVIDVEDLIILAINYQGVSAPKLPPPTSAQGVEQVWIDLADRVTVGQVLEVPIRLSGAGRLQLVSVALGWDPEIVEPIAVTPGDFLAAQQGIVLSPRAGALDGALLGAREVGIQGEGILGTVTFRAIATGSAGIDFEYAFGRDAANRPVPVETSRTTSAVAALDMTGLLPGTPNPFRQNSPICFGLATATLVDLSIYSADGRHVRTLSRTEMRPGIYRIPWNGTDDLGHAVASGIFYVRLKTKEKSFTTKLVYLK